MPSGPNYIDANGFLRPGEDALVSPVSDWLDPFIEQFSDNAADVEARLVDLQQGTLSTGSYTGTGNSGTTAYWGTFFITFPNAYTAPPIATAECTTTGAIAFTQILGVSATQIQVRVVRLFVAPGTLAFRWAALGTLA